MLEHHGASGKPSYTIITNTAVLYITSVLYYCMQCTPAIKLCENFSETRGAKIVNLKK